MKANAGSVVVFSPREQTQDVNNFQMPKKTTKSQ